MSFWYERLREIKEENNLSNYQLAKILDTDITAVSRYETGRGSKSFTKNLKRKLSDVFSKEEISYIENGKNKPTISQNGTKNNQIVGDGNSIGSCTKKDNKVITECLPADILNVVEMMGEMDKTKRRQVLRFVLDLEDK
ncbi:MAG: helix-turn-helix transcriptional regulator [Sulfurovum sp.]